MVSLSPGFILGSWQTNLGQLDALLPPTGLCDTIDLCQDVVILHLQFTLESIKYITIYYLVVDLRISAVHYYYRHHKKLSKLLTKKLVHK